MHCGLVRGGRLEDTASLHCLGFRRDGADDLLRREAAGGRVGNAVQLQAEAHNPFSMTIPISSWRRKVAKVLARHQAESPITSGFTPVPVGEMMGHGPPTELLAGIEPATRPL